MSSDVCPICKGFGSVPVVSEGPPVRQMCSCLLKREIINNTERGMRGLSRYPKVAASPLWGRETENLWITGTPEWFLPNVRHVAIRKPPTWNFHVCSDADMMTAWLATAALSGSTILDPEVRAEAASVSLTKLTLVDLVHPPALLIIRLGVKVARNVAMSEVFHEALTIRAHANRPTWVWDQPENPLRQGHMCWSDYGVSFMDHWKRLEEGRTTPTSSGNGAQASSRNHAQGSIRDMFLTPGPKGGSK